MPMLKIAISLLLGAAGAASLAQTGPNLLQNPGFAEGETGWGLTKPFYEIDTRTGREDSASLHSRRTAETPYVLCHQVIPAEPGKQYLYGAWVKTENVQGEVKICLEWSGMEGYIGGSYIGTGVSGTTGCWRQMLFTAPPASAGTTRVNLTFLASDASPEIRIRLSEAEGASFSAEGWRVRAFLRQQPEMPPLEQADLSPWEGGKARASLPTEKLPVGASYLGVRLNSSDRLRTYCLQTEAIRKSEWLSLEIASPNAMGTVIGKERVSCRVNIQNPPESRPENFEIRLSLIPFEPGQPPLPLASRKAVAGKAALIALPFDRATPGSYDLEAALHRPGSPEPRARARKMVSRPALSGLPPGLPLPLPSGLMSANGEAILPVGIYMLSAITSLYPVDSRVRIGKRHNPDYYGPVLEMVARSPLNCVLDYGGDMGQPLESVADTRRFLDDAHRLGVRVIYSIKDFVVRSRGNTPLPPRDDTLVGPALRKIKDHPALLAIYIDDEAFDPAVWPSYLAAYRRVREIVPRLPSYSVHYYYQASEMLAKGSDIYGTDPYVLMGDIRSAVVSWRTARQAMSPEQPMWAVVQVFGSGYEMSNPADTCEPTYEEVRSGVFCALAEGANCAVSARKRNPWPLFSTCRPRKPLSGWRRAKRASALGRTKAASTFSSPARSAGNRISSCNGLRG
ncbi:MAG: hypothetical protein IT210_20420 [Armatimonadetes bacterium]|nr:hypothetical protein [Armatimonadota bacterium]